MPFIEGQQDEEEKKQQDAQQQGQLQLQAGVAGGAAPAPGGAPPPAGGAAAPAPSQSAGQAPGRYVNFQNYFNANKDAATASGNKLAGGIEAQGQGVQADLAKRTTAFGAAVDAGAPSRPTIQAPTAAAVAGPPAAPAQAGATQTPIGSAPGPVGYSAALAATPAKYTGPNSMGEASGWDELVGKANRTASEAKQTGTAGGVQALLQQQQKGQPYTQGQSKFDAALTGAASGDRFAKLREQFSGLGKAASDANAASAGRSAYAREVVAGTNAANAAMAPRPAVAPAAVEAPAGSDRDAAIKNGLHSGTLNDYERGAWGQVDPFGRGDARKFQGDVTSHDLGYSEREIKDLYESMTPDEYLEYRWLVGDGGQDTPHPDAPQGKYKDGMEGKPISSIKESPLFQAQGAALKKFLEKVKANHVSKAPSYLKGFAAYL